MSQPPCLNPDYSTTRNVIRAGVEPPATSGPSGGLRSQGYRKTDLPDRPLVTIVTVVLNSPEFLRETIHSVIYQSYDNIEYIVVDGGSTDGETLSIIKSYEHAIDLWISEPDSGIYNAMNKSIDLARGTIINFLNADDHFFDGRVVERVVERFRKTGAKMVYGDTFMLNRESGYGWLRLSNVNQLYFLFKGIPQQAFFYHRSLFDDYGRFAEDFKIAADLDYFLKLVVEHDVPTRYMHSPLVIFGIGATSSDAKLLREERDRVLPRYFPAYSRALFQNDLFRSLLVRNELFPQRRFVDKVFARLTRRWALK